MTPSAYDSGESRRSQGISKAGNSLVRGVMIQVAWLWIKHQPESELTKWFRRRTKDQSKRLGTGFAYRSCARYMTTA